MNSLSTRPRRPFGRAFPLAVIGSCLLAISTVHIGAAEPGLAPVIEQELRSFRQMGRVLHVGAHPDDENTQLIAYLARGRRYQIAYLSLTRGDGGQNEIGAEFDEKLGVARTQELLAARRIDGGRQFFTRAIDFGYSKTPEETLRIWDHQQVLADVVRVIRTFCPDVIITRFPVPPGSGGHGHHTASAILALEAFKLAGDEKSFPEQIAQGLKPWQPKRILWNGGGGRGGSAAGGTAIHVDIGGSDPVTGESFGEIASHSRSMHKTQGFGNFGRGGRGANIQTFTLLAGEPATNDIMDGVDLTWNRLSSGAEIARLADEVIERFKPDDPSASIPTLLTIRSKLSSLPSDPVLADKRQQLDRILQACLGLNVETTVPSPEATPGETLALHHAATVRSSFPLRWRSVRYPEFNRDATVSAVLRANEAAILDLKQTIPSNAIPSQPYWLQEEGTPGMFRVDDPKLIGRPENPPDFPVEFVFEISGQTLIVPDEPVSTADLGKKRRLVIISPVAIHFDSTVSLLKPGGRKMIELELTAARAVPDGSAQLEGPADWAISPARVPVNFSRPGETTNIAFSVTAPSKASSARLSAVVTVNGVRFSNQRIVIRYEHIAMQLLQPRARLKVDAFDFEIRGKSVGYLPGAGDDAATSLRELGYQVTTLSDADLIPEKLRGFDAVVIGVRAFNVRKDLEASLPSLFSYVESGGTVLAQYNRPNGLRAKELGPYPLSIEGNAPQLRVTDENAPVTILAPGHPALTVPNQIRSVDFEGWVQERGAYFPSSWDADHYTALLSMSDPGEAPLKSAVLVASYGKGYYVYTGLAFFRQLPAGVPGAYRLFANLVSLGK